LLAAKDEVVYSCVWHCCVRQSSQQGHS